MLLALVAVAGGGALLWLLYRLASYPSYLEREEERDAACRRAGEVYSPRKITDDIYIQMMSDGQYGFCPEIEDEIDEDAVMDAWLHE